MLYGGYNSEKRAALKKVGKVPLPEPDKIYTKAEAAELYNAQYDHLKAYLDALQSEVNGDKRKRSRARNEKCPNCGSTEVNDRIKRIQGSGSGSISGDFFLGCGSISGSSSSTIDTNEVNKCNGCNHEWKKDEYNFETEKDIFEDLTFYPSYYYNKFVDAKAGKKDTSSRAPSWREEKDEEDDEAEKFLTNANNRLRGYCKEVIRSYVKEKYYSGYDMEKRLTMCKMPDENWKAWGGTVVNVEKTVISDPGSFLNKLFFWRKEKA